MLPDRAPSYLGQEGNNIPSTKQGTAHGLGAGNRDTHVLADVTHAVPFCIETNFCLYLGALLYAP